MKIGGLQKTSLIDYPEKISAIVWTVGCNFRCPFCYNKNLVFNQAESIRENEVFDFLEKRKGLIDGLVITGGEPFIQNDLSDFIKKVKDLEYLIKVDTNGTYPKKIKQVLDKNLIDYIAMDVKAPKIKYSELSGVKTDTSKIQESIDIIKKQAPNYEFRTTFIPKLLKKEDILEIGKWLDGADKYFLQQFKNNPELISSDVSKYKPYSKEYILKTIEEILPYFNFCDVRGL
jgi:pyruvate formate lyase activating enzyme